MTGLVTFLRPIRRRRPVLWPILILAIAAFVAARVLFH